MPNRISLIEDNNLDKYTETQRHILYCNNHTNLLLLILFLRHLFEYRGSINYFLDHF